MIIEAIILSFLIFLASFLSIIFHLPGLYSNLLFFGLPSLYLSYLSPKNIRQAFLYSLIATPPVVLMFDYIMQLSQVWFVPTIFSFKILDVVPIEQFVWGFLYTYLFIIFYKYFFDKNNLNLHIFANKKLSIFFISWILIAYLIMLILLHYGIIIPYLYIIMGILFIIFPSVIIYLYYPKVLFKIIKTIPYNFALSLVFELTALHLEQWAFPGKYYLGWIQIFNYRLPFEELFLFMFLFSFLVLIYFEIWADDLA